MWVPGQTNPLILCNSLCSSILENLLQRVLFIFQTSCLKRSSIFKWVHWKECLAISAVPLIWGWNIRRYITWHVSEKEGSWVGLWSWWERQGLRQFVFNDTTNDCSHCYHDMVLLLKVCHYPYQTKQNIVGRSKRYIFITGSF